MSAIVSVRDLGNPETEKWLRNKIEEFMEIQSGNWDISVLGSQSNDLWELKVTGPDGRAQSVKKIQSSGKFEGIRQELASLIGGTASV